MRDTVAEIIGSVLVVVGVGTLFGEGWALLTAGVLVLIWVELNGYLAARTKDDR